MDIQNQAKLLLTKLVKIVPTMLVIGTSIDKHGLMFMTSPEETEDKRVTDLCASIASIMETREEVRTILLSAICWFLQENPEHRKMMQVALDKMKEIEEMTDEHNRTTEPK